VATRIDSYVNLIPPRYYLNENQQDALKEGENNKTKKKKSMYDPALCKTTSQLLAELGGAQKQSSGSSSKKKNGKKQKVKESFGEGLSRNELRDKLQLRIAELKDERRRRQSEKDKNKAKEIREARAANGQPVKERASAPSKAAREQTSETGQSKKRKEVGVPRNAVVEDDIDTGKLDFEPQAADVPFEATVNPKGTKGAKLQKAIREEEARKRKIAEVAGDSEAEAAINNELQMKRALARARGEKVHDDVSRLRKSQKINDKKKKKTKEKWNARIETVEKAIQDKQKTRKENIQKKVQSKKKNRDAKRGFEGKVEGYLNKE
jgi:hypothetical protein